MVDKPNRGNNYYFETKMETSFKVSIKGEKSFLSFFKAASIWFSSSESLLSFSLLNRGMLHKTLTFHAFNDFIYKLSSGIGRFRGTRRAIGK